MGAPFTQDEIQTEIDYYKDELRKAASSQAYAYQEGPVGDFSVRRGKVEEIQKTLQFWIDMMKEYYPTVYASQPQIEFNEIGYVNG